MPRNLTDETGLPLHLRDQRGTVRRTLERKAAEERLRALSGGSLRFSLWRTRNRRLLAGQATRVSADAAGRG